LVTHRWLRAKFCKRACKDAYLRELALGRDKLRRWYGWPLRRSGSLGEPASDQARPHKLAHYLGDVQASDESAAEVAAVTEFNLSEEQRKRLVVQERD
jgi:hypothetical protein